jgi:DNA-binding transcriptional regulator YbjK
MRRKPNPEQRRRELCDAAIQLLADDGAKGVSHLKVDRLAGVPDGTTSFYFRTRSALLHAVATRVAELDLDELRDATRRAAVTNGSGSHPSGLATLVMRSATGARLTRTKARNELVLQAFRDPAVAVALRENNPLFLGLIRDAVLAFQPAGSEPDADHVDTQAYVVMMFISGVMQAFTSGDRRIKSAAELDGLISGIVRGVCSTSVECEVKRPTGQGSQT